MLLKLSYIGLSITMLTILFFIGKYAINKSVIEEPQKKKKTIQLVLGLVLWQIYLFGIVSTGFLYDLSFPPRFVVFLIRSLRI